jgi:ribulose-phosphate 3-epimerase
LQPAKQQKNMRNLLSPSLLSADFANLQKGIEQCNSGTADWLHLDIMDGVFVPNITYGMPVAKAIKKHASKPLDVHLMIVEPDRYLEAFRDAGAEVLTVHYEACSHLHRTVQRIKELGMAAGVAINPHTPVSLLEEILPCLDMVLVMSVNPGFGGQSFIPGAISKIEKLAAMASSLNPCLIIQVDGGISAANAAAVKKAGATCLVAGSAVFGAADPIHAMKQIKDA